MTLQEIGEEYAISRERVRQLVEKSLRRLRSQKRIAFIRDGYEQAELTLTMLITIFFLGPTIGRVYGFFSLFANSSLFLHLINPLVAIAVFAWLERPGRIPKGKILWGIVPTVAYAIYYVALTLSHVAGDRIAEGYDWYGFLAFGIHAWWIVVIVILLITFGITLALWRLNRGKPEKKTDTQ